jgi:hypothetical protein
MPIDELASRMSELAGLESEPIVFVSRSGARAAVAARLLSVVGFCEAFVLDGGMQRWPDLVFFDGQGIAHPRKIGIAAHMGVLLDLPTIGVAKSPLAVHGQEPGQEPGAWVPWRNRAGEEIAAAVRTKARSKPLYISPGHKMDLPTAIEYVLASCRGYRLPEPTRLAGEDRYETGAAVVAYSLANGLLPDRVAIASGTRFPDALAGSVLAARARAPMLLATASSLPAPTRDALAAAAPRNVRLYVLGGTSAIADSTVDRVEAVLRQARRYDTR